MAAEIRFKSALGLGPSDANPPWPEAALTATDLPSEEALWQSALAHNPELAAMRSMVEMALATSNLASTARTPDFSFGLMADLKANPLMLRPTASISLPIWRDKIEAAITAAANRQHAANARLQNAELSVAIDIAQMLHMAQEADRMIDYIEKSALPNLDRILSSAVASLQSGMSSASEIPGARLMAIAMKRERLAALRQHEDAAANLAFLTAGIAPPHAPLLTESQLNR